MTKDEVAERLSIMLGYDIQDENQARMFDEATKHIDIVDDCELDVDNVEAYALKLSRDTGKKYGAIIWDFLDYVPANEKASKGDTERNSYVAKRIRQLGKDLKMAQVILVQVPKEKGGIGNIKIGQDAPMNAGNITNVSHMLLTAWRPFKGSSIGSDNCMILYPAKHRSGKSDYEVKCRFEGERYLIKNIESEPV